MPALCGKLVDDARKEENSRARREEEEREK